MHGGVVQIIRSSNKEYGVFSDADLHKKLQRDVDDEEPFSRDSAIRCAETWLRKRKIYTLLLCGMR